jgi:hypothetical protein
MVTTLPETDTSMAVKVSGESSSTKRKIIPKNRIINAILSAPPRKGLIILSGWACDEFLIGRHAEPGLAGMP